MYQKPGKLPITMSSDDNILSLGDRLVVLADINGLRDIEQGELHLELKNWQVLVEKIISQDANFEGARIISRISGFSLSLARESLTQVPGILPKKLYKKQAQHLVEQLKKALVKASLVANN